MSAERARLLSIDFSQRFRDLLRRARQGNVSFYTVRPGGLDPNVSMMDDGLSNLQVLAEQTDGIAVLNTNDLRTGMTKIANDLSSHYVLGYYTNNSKWDGGTRKITVRLKGTGKAIRARREYRAPTEEDMAALRSATAAAAAPAGPSAPQLALSALSRVSPSSRLNAYGTVIGNEVAIVAEIAAAEIEGGRFKQGAEVDVLFSAKDGGEPVALKGKIEPGSRGTVIKVPTNAATGPWQAVVRMRGEDNLSDSDTVAIERPTGALLGKPLAYRAASAAASAYKPLAAFQFRRTERVRLEWPVSQAARRASGAAARSHRQADCDPARNGDPRRRRHDAADDDPEPGAVQQRRLSDRDQRQGGREERDAADRHPGVDGAVSIAKQCQKCQKCQKC